MRIYCDGIFDLVHNGHIKHFKKIHDLFDEPIYLIVGIISDKVATGYKRVPILNENIRYNILSNCVYTSECIITDQLIMTEEFLEFHKIDYVVHGFNDTIDKAKQSEFFEIPIRLNKFKELEYNEGVSTTQIIHDNNIDWKEVIDNGDIIEILFKLNNLDKSLFTSAFC